MFSKRSISGPVSATRYVTCALLMIAHTAAADELKPFTSDGCSAFPDGTPTQQELWLQCCTAHDRAYWAGGTYQQRLDADRALRSCVEQVGEPEIAALMLVGVRVGGSLPTRFRWGYGWDWPRWYGPLSADELREVEAAANAAQ